MVGSIVIVKLCELLVEFFGKQGDSLDIITERCASARLGDLLSPAKVSGGRYSQRMAAMANR